MITARAPYLASMLLFPFIVAGPCAAAAQRSDSLDYEIRAAVYQAEVLGELDAGLDTLRAILSRAVEPTQRAVAVAAIAAIKHPLPRPSALSRSSLAAETAQAILCRRGNAYLLCSGHWFELGDWLGDVYLAQIRPTGLVLATLDGSEREHAMAQFHDLPTTLMESGDYCVLARARAGDVLEFITKRAGLGSFFPSAIQKKISGTFAVSDWQGFMDQVCEEAAITWTRRRDNVVFRGGPYAESIPFPRINLDRKNQNLVTFLQNLARDMKLELVLDEGLGDISVDVHLQDQAWDEVLDCLSIMNGFNWSLIREGADPPKLFIQKE